jgi:hypothetical protein
MANVLSPLLGSIQVTGGGLDSGLQVFGLVWPSQSTAHYITLDEALSAGSLEISELTEAGHVPALRVANHGDANVFLMAGEHLVGAKQDRVLNASVMVGPQSQITITVSCVEAGRWRYRSPKFGSGRMMSHGLLRKMMSPKVTEGYRASGTPTSDQGEVWNEIHRKLGAMGSVSPTAAFSQAYADHHQRLDAVMTRFPAPSGFGVAFAIDGLIAGVDLFDQPSTLAKLWPKLIRAYALDALELGPAPTTENPVVTTDAVAQWVRSAAGAQAEPFPSSGLGTDLRLDGPALSGASLVVDNQPIHLELFPVPTEASA